MSELTLLIVDDDELHCEMVSDMLEGEYKIFTAQTSDDATTLFREHHPVAPRDFYELPAQ